jgi:plastocyanin
MKLKLLLAAVVAVAMFSAGACSDDNDTIVGPNPTATATPPPGTTATATPPAGTTATPTPPVGNTPTPTPPAGGATATVDVGPGGGNAFVDRTSGNSTTTINAGDTVEWIWQTGFHSTTSGTCTTTCQGDGVWDSGVGTGMTFSHTFTQSGTFPYFCLSHGAMMQGTVVVQ